MRTLRAFWIVILLAASCKAAPPTPQVDPYRGTPPAATSEADDPLHEPVMQPTVEDAPLYGPTGVAHNSGTTDPSRSAFLGNGIRCDVNNSRKCDATDQAIVSADITATAVKAGKTATPQPTVAATATKAPTAQPGPTSTPSMAMLGKCGESMEQWHGPTIDGCATGHEHGDPPPIWVSQSPKPPLFHGDHGTGPAENTLKHNFMKGYVLVDTQRSCLTAYVIQHGSEMGMERIARFHSTQFWIKDCFGGISYGSMWTDFGVAKLYPRGDRVEPGNFDAVHAEKANQGIMRISRSPNPTCNQWYGAAFGNRPDVSLLLCDAPERYNDAEETNPNGEYLPENWQLTGGLGLFRQYELVWPLGRIVAGVYTTDQFGRPVANCVTGNGTTSYDGADYGLLCQKWVIQPSFVESVNQKAAEFGIKRLFALYRNEDIDGPGVVAPN